VIAQATLLRPLLTPLIYGLLLRLKNDDYFLQFFNLPLGLVNVLLFYFLANIFTRRFWILLASLLIAFNPNLLIETRFIVAEQLFIFWLLAFFLVY